MKQKGIGNISKERHTLHKHVGLMGIFSGVLFLLAVGIIVASATAPTITDWNNTKTTDNPKDIMFLVAPGDVISFSVIVNQSVDYTWEVAKIDQNNNQNSFTWTVPNEQDIWEIHLKVSNAEGEGHLEWVISTLNTDEAPDIFEYFSDFNYTGRADTDPWGRALPDWTLKYGSPNITQGYYQDGGDVPGSIYTSSTIAYGTWKYRWRFPNAVDDWTDKILGVSYVYIDYITRYQRVDSEDGHQHSVFRHDGEVFRLGYDGGGVYEDNEWHQITIVRDSDGWTYMYKDDMFDLWAYDNTITSNSYVRVDLDKQESMYFDCLEVYDGQYLFPDTGIIYANYIWNYENYYPTPLKRNGIVVIGRNVTLSDINTAINDASLFSYHATTKTATINSDLVLFDGAELVMTNETLLFDCSSDGSLHFALKYGSTLKMTNSTISTVNDNYFIWNNAGSTTHLAHSNYILDPKEIYTNFGSYYSCASGKGSCPMISTGVIYDPFEIQFQWYGRFIMENSVINNTAHMFFDSPYEINIVNSQITNLHEVDIGNYYSGTGGADYKVARDVAKGDKSFWVYTDDANLYNYVIDNVTITRANGESRTNITFMTNAHRDKNNLYNINMGSENLVIKESLAQTRRQSHSCTPYVFKSYIDSALGVVNCKFNELIITQGTFYDNAGNPVEKIGLVKYYLDVKVVDEAGVPISDAMVSVRNEIDTNYPSENINVTKPYATGDYSSLYHHYRFVDGQSLNSTITDADGHTPLPWDKYFTLVISDYVTNINGTQSFTYNITVSKDGKFASMSGLDIDETWYREDSNTPKKTVLCNIDTGECWVETVATSAPTTNVTITPAPNDAEVVVTFFRSDNSSGISYTSYSKISETGPWTMVNISTANGLDAGNVTAISEDKFNVTVWDSGNTSIWYYSVGNNFNVETTKSIIVNRNPIAEWHFNEGTGVSVEDISGNNNNGTLVNMDATNWVPGKNGTALQFDGVDDYVDCGNDASLDITDAITIELWLKPNVAGEGVRNAAPVCKAEAEVDWSWQLRYNAPDGGNYMGFQFNGDPEGSTWVSVNQNLTPGDWYHVAGTFDGTTLRCYLNGVETDTNHLSAIKSGNATLFIGQDGWGNIFNGVVDELKLYNRALSVDEVRADYEAGFVELNSLSGTVTSPCGTNIANATVTLTTLEGAEINTTQTDSTGNYAFANVAPDYYDITATKRSYWSNTNNVTVTTEAPETADIVLCQKGDFNINSEPADAGDLAMMADATAAGTSDVTYDLDGDGNPADEADLTLLKDVSVGVAELE